MPRPGSMGGATQVPQSSPSRRGLRWWWSVIASKKRNLTSNDRSRNCKKPKSVLSNQNWSQSNHRNDQADNKSTSIHSQTSGTSFWASPWLTKSLICWLRETTNQVSMMDHLFTTGYLTYTRPSKLWRRTRSSRIRITRSRRRWRSALSSQR